ncbi:putative Rho guanyl nucleotide exchange factor [Taphrina deformans PYCC 5710]|uniref:Rho guanyl nucleotide exchange factor n=1 Tax=Taphrina deformans (strain PYCC 5710 / ATCC 11124 / CBS 356.35 / IMI 108563 / JCM 9778 / NBRC 8474) TaxID=1097556 RepID=R4X9F0_TAPDE|nr:putative Rho guanyl nucleotide exchange factor [Taphrina deformans PYCC 5710]|eukprot:CCG80839.1 putative Rho guanyl nucleotide exchange factor [Taphrina deformans PYCC 5710]
MQGSSLSLIETEGLNKEDLELLRVLKRRQAILRELVTTESSFADDLAVVVEEYQSKTKSCPQLSKDDARQIFGGVEPVMAFSRDFAGDLQNAAYSVLFSEAVSMESLHYEDAQTGVGIVFGQSIGRLSRVFSRYCSTHETAAKCLQKVSKDPAVQKWLADRHPVDKTTAWDLPSLLIKPIQRIMKYPLLLSALLEATPSTHADYHAIDSAHKEILLVAEDINNIKKRRDLVGSVTADRKKNDFTALAKTFSRRAPKTKQSPGLEEEAEYTDLVYDRLVASFRAQEAVIGTLRVEVQDWLLAMKSALEYHAKLAFAFEEVQSCRDTAPSSMSPTVDWTCYTKAISDLQLGAFVELTHNLEREVFHPLALLESNFTNPRQIIERQDQQAELLQRKQTNSSRGLSAESHIDTGFAHLPPIYKDGNGRDRESLGQGPK